MAKLKKAMKIYEPDEDITHYAAPSGLGQATLCGVPDWLGGRTPGEETNRLVNCFSCIEIVKHVKATRFE